MVQDANDLEGLIAHLEELTEEWEEDHTQEFLAHLHHDAPEVRAAAVRGLWESVEPGEVLDPLLVAAEQDPDEEVRATAVSVLGRYIYEGSLLMDRDEIEPEFDVDPEAIGRVRTYLEGLLVSSSQPELVRRRALEALAFDPGPTEVELMEQWAKDASPALRTSALFAMGRSGLEQWEQPILRGLRDEVPEVRREAIRAIGEACIDAGIPYLKRYIEGDDRELQLEAIHALGQVGGEEAIELLNEIIDTAEDEELAEMAEAALEHAEEFEFTELDDENV